MKPLLVLSVLLLSGCAGFGGLGQPNMSAEQLNAVTKDKNFSAACSNISGPWGAGKVVYVNVDKSVVVNGTIAVAPDCTVTMSNEATVRAAPVLAPVKP